MEDKNPVVVQALSVSGAIIVAKSLFAFAKAVGWIDTSNPDVEAAWLGLIEDALPIAILWIGALWAARRTTSLKDPRDVDGAPLTRSKDQLPIAKLEKLQSEAIKMDRRIQR